MSEQTGATEDRYTPPDEFSRGCTVGMVTVTHGQVLARFGHALSDPTRSRLLLALREAPGYPALRAWRPR